MAATVVESGDDFAGDPAHQQLGRLLHGQWLVAARTALAPNEEAGIGNSITLHIGAAQQRVGIRAGLIADRRVVFAALGAA